MQSRPEARADAVAGDTDLEHNDRRAQGTKGTEFGYTGKGSRTITTSKRNGSRIPRLASLGGKGTQERKASSGQEVHKPETKAAPARGTRMRRPGPAVKLSPKTAKKLANVEPLSPAQRDHIVAACVSSMEALRIDRGQTPSPARPGADVQATRDSIRRGYVLADFLLGGETEIQGVNRDELIEEMKRGVSGLQARKAYGVLGAGDRTVLPSVNTAGIRAEHSSAGGTRELSKELRALTQQRVRDHKETLGDKVRRESEILGKLAALNREDDGKGVMAPREERQKEIKSEEKALFRELLELRGSKYLEPQVLLFRSRARGLSSPSLSPTSS